MNMPIGLLLIPYAIFVLFFIFYGAFNVYHLLRFGVYRFHLYAVCVLFAGGSTILLVASISALASFDWTAALALGIASSSSI